MNSKSRSLLLMAAAMAAMGSQPNTRHYDDDNGIFKPESKPKVKRIPDGCSKYIINGIDIIALDYKRAIKKYIKMNKPQHRYTITILFKQNPHLRTVEGIFEHVKTLKEAESYESMIDDTVLFAHISDNITGKIIKHLKE